jgi:hypothetical protein
MFFSFFNSRGSNGCVLSVALLALSACAPAGSTPGVAPVSVAKYSQVDSQGKIPASLKENALAYYDQFQSEVSNRDEFSIIDFSAISGEKDLYKIKLTDGSVTVAHLADGSEEIGDGEISDDSLIYTEISGDPEDESDSIAQAVPGAVIEVAPLWEAKRPRDGLNWTLFSRDVVLTSGASLMAGTKDMANFCPSYSKLTTNQKANFWVYLISAVTKYESNFNPTSRYRESTMGIDPITKQRVYSEGLLQLSYQDVRGYPFCNEFNWNIDKNLSPTDPKKTILDPYKNLRCGIKILNKIVGKKGLIAFNSGHYWSTLQPRNSTERAIQALVNKIPFCKK